MVDQAEIHRKAISSEVEERERALEQFYSNFAVLPDKQQAWGDIIRLTHDKYDEVRSGAAYALGAIFQHIPYKEQALKDLHRLTQEGDGDVRWGAAYALAAAFPYITDKKQVWEDLHRLTEDEDSEVRRGAAEALGTVFQHAPDKAQAWKDLHRLTQDEECDVRSGTTYVLGDVFQHVSDKAQAWKDLHRLTQDEVGYVRAGAAKALGTVFQHISDKEQTLKDLHRLTQDKNRVAKANANHSLGSVSIFKATETESEEGFRNELQKALYFFEQSLKEPTLLNLSSFCLPFYRSFYTITFEKAEGEVQKYIAEAKSASKGSANKETLLEAVENLANALSEAHKATDFGAMKSDLNACRLYLDRAADLIGDASDGAPGAARVLRRGLPIIDDRIEEILREVQEKARAVCRETQETPLEELGLATARSAQELPTQDPLALTMAFGSMASIARDWCEYLPTGKKLDACEQLDNLPDMELSEQGAAIVRVFEYVQGYIHIPKIQTVHILGREQEIVRIAVAQISFELTESFPFTVKNRDKVKTKVFSALGIAKQNGANIVCLPELCLCEDWIGEIRKRYPDMIVIGGSFYKDKMNICPVIMKSDAVIPYQPKITPAVTEYDLIPGDRIYRYETRFGKFVILICTDFDDLAHYFREADIDMIFCPSFNSANERFWNEAHSHVERTPSYILIANTGLHGGTSIFGQLNNKYFGGLVDGGCKKLGDSTYKLCEVKKGQEEVIIADFNLDHKGAQVLTPSNPNKVLKSVDHINKIPIQPDRSRSKIGKE